MPGLAVSPLLINKSEEEPGGHQNRGAEAGPCQAWPSGLFSLLSRKRSRAGISTVAQKLGQARLGRLASSHY